MTKITEEQAEEMLEKMYGLKNSIEYMKKVIAEWQKLGYVEQRSDYFKKAKELTRNINDYNFSLKGFDRSGEKDGVFINYIKVVDYQKLCTYYEKHIEQLEKQIKDNK